jgi:hypothetical protein
MIVGNPRLRSENQKSYFANACHQSGNPSS